MKRTLIEIFYPKPMNSAKRYRLTNGYNQAELAKELGVSRQTIINWEAGRGQEHIYKLFEFLNSNKK